MKKKIIQKRFNILKYIIIFLFFLVIIFLYKIQIIECEKYKKEYKEATEKIVYGETPPRGRILDRFGNIIVDNKPVRIISYKKPIKIKEKDEIKLAYTLTDLLDINYNKISEDNLKTFWLKNNYEKGYQKITEQERLDYRYRKITSKEIDKLKKERITEEELNNFTERDKEAAYIYYLMNKGYSYTEKIIKSIDVTDKEYAIISTRNDLKGIEAKLDWEREYIYGDNLKSILGSVTSKEKGLPEDLKDYYLNKGYNLDDRVGSSYLEYQYDDYLKGVKNKYKLLNDNTLELIGEGKRGNDIVLTIDINLQKEIENILKEEMIKAKEEANTTFYNRSFVIITDPKTGEIIAMAGKQIVNVNGEYVFYDYTPGIYKSSVTVGSVIKGASQIVGYNTGSLTIGEKRYDKCVKLKSMPEKCSWKYLGLLDDLQALKMSSNTYQFYTALKVAGQNYFYNMPSVDAKEAFNTYRNTFKEFGLGTLTGIDLPNEITGIEGKSTNSALLLDFSIGQYDNYTPLELSQYISTIANNGVRLKLHLLKEVKENDNTIFEQKPEELNKVATEQIYLNRVKEGFKKVMEYGGTGSGYINLDYNPAGKTGTSQSFVDSDNDGKIDHETVSNTFVAYAPNDDPKVTFTVVSPDVYDYSSDFQSQVNKRISKRISEKYFEIYK